MRLEGQQTKGDRKNHNQQQNTCQPDSGSSGVTDFKGTGRVAGLCLSVSKRIGDLWQIKFYLSNWRFHPCVLQCISSLFQGSAETDVACLQRWWLRDCVGGCSLAGGLCLLTLLLSFLIVTFPPKSSDILLKRQNKEMLQLFLRSSDFCFQYRDFRAIISRCSVSSRCLLCIPWSVVLGRKEVVHSSPAEGLSVLSWHVSPFMRGFTAATPTLAIQTH